MTLHLETLEFAARAALAEATGAWREGSIETDKVFAQDPDALGPERVLLQLNRHFPHNELPRYLAMLHPEAVLDLIARMNSAAGSLVREVDRLVNECIRLENAGEVVREELAIASAEIGKLENEVIDKALAVTKPRADTEAMLMRYIDKAKESAGAERVTGEPLADFIKRILEELNALRAEVGS